MSEDREAERPGEIATVEAACLDARDALDQADLARARDLNADLATLDAEAERLARPVRAALGALASRTETLSPEDRRAVEAMRTSVDAPGKASGGWGAGRPALGRRAHRADRAWREGPLTPRGSAG